MTAAQGHFPRPEYAGTSPSGVRFLARVRKAVVAVVASFFAAASLFSAANAQSLLRDAEIEQFLKDYADPLFAAAGLDPKFVKVYIVGDNSLNAFVTAGQKVFVHTGLIVTADTPNQIQGVLAHETGHIAGGHQQRGSEAYAKASKPAMLSLVLGATVIAAGGPPEAAFALGGLGQTVGIAEYLSYSQGQESAADQAGVSYLEAVGASGEGLIEFFGKLKNNQLIRASKIDPYLSTHPMALKRMNRLRERVEAQPSFDVKDSPEEIDRLHMIQAKINGFMQAPQATMRQYPLADHSDPARYARAVAYYRDSRLQDALREIGRLIDAHPDNPFFWELKGQMLFEHGKIAESIAPHERSVQLAPQYALLKVNLARSLIATERNDDVKHAVTILQDALRMENDNSFAWSELARAEALLGNEAAASLAQAQAFFARGDLPSAHRFASRARDLLEPGTPAHLQALDIIATTEDIARKARNKGRRRQ